MTAFLQQFAFRLLEWVVRPRNIGLKLIGAGVALFGIALGMDVLGQLDYVDGQRHLSFKFATGDSLPAWMTIGAYCIAAGLVVIGLVVVLTSYVNTERLASRRLCVVVELRGLHSSPDTPAKDADLGSLPRQRQGLKIDFRPRTEDELVNPRLVLQQLAAMKANICAASEGRDPSDVAVAVGGLGAVPALFLAGMLIDDESAVTLYDWHRDIKRWQVIDGPDDGKRMLPADLSGLPEGISEVVLAVSLSYSVDLSAIKASLPLLRVVELRAELVKADTYWSTEKQQAVVTAFRDVVQELMQRSITRIHLIVATPASLAIRLGMSYDRRLFPELLVYQYERSRVPPYPWAFQMPTHGQPAATLVETPVAPYLSPG
jgi:hypothetical protein